MEWFDLCRLNQAIAWETEGLRYGNAYFYFEYIHLYSSKYSFIRKEFRKNVRKTFSEIRKGIYEYQLKVALKLAWFDFCWLIVLMLAK